MTGDATEGIWQIERGAATDLGSPDPWARPHREPARTPTPSARRSSASGSTASSSLPPSSASWTSTPTPYRRPGVPDRLRGGARRAGSGQATGPVPGSTTSTTRCRAWQVPPHLAVQLRHGAARLRTNTLRSEADCLNSGYQIRRRRSSRMTGRLIAAVRGEAGEPNAAAGSSLRRCSLLQHRAVRLAEDRPAILDFQPETTGFVDEPMMAPAQQHEVRKRSGSAVGPMDDMVRVAPRRRAVAAGEPAVQVADGDGAAHRSRHR